MTDPAHKYECSRRGFLGGLVAVSALVTFPVPPTERPLYGAWVEVPSLDDETVDAYKEFLRNNWQALQDRAGWLLEEPEFVVNRMNPALPYRRGFNCHTIGWRAHRKGFLL